MAEELREEKSEGLEQIPQRLCQTENFAFYFTTYTHLFLYKNSDGFPSPNLHVKLIL